MTFTDTLQQRSIKFRHAFERGELWLCCLFCVERGEPTPDTKFKLGLNYITKEGHCFRCDWSSRDAVNDYLAKLGTSAAFLDEQVVIVKPPPPKLPEDFQLLHSVSKDDEIVYEAYRYLTNRGIQRRTMADKQLGVSLTGRYAYRILFPVWWRRKLKGIVARDFTKTAKIKYLNSPGEKYLYNLPSKCQSVILSEGVFKALAIEKATDEVSAALLGHSITSNMIKQLKYANCKEITIWPDPDAVGIEGALTVAQQLKDIAKVYFISPVPIKQADELSSEEILHRYKARVPYSFTLYRQAAAKAAFRR